VARPGIEDRRGGDRTTQIPLEGESFKASLHDEKAKGRETQFYSMLSTRAIYLQHPAKQIG
jgi:hypothetical protein